MKAGTMVVPRQPLPGNNHDRGLHRSVLVVRRIVAIVLVVAACSGGSPTLPGTLGEVDDEVKGVVGTLAREFDTFFPSRITLYERLSTFGTTAAVGDLYDQVSRLEEPAIASDLERYTRFVGDLLLASGDIDAAANRDDFYAVATAWLRIEAASGVMAVGLDPEWCPEVSMEITADLCRPEVVQDYDAAVERTIRLFLARYRPLVRVPHAFGNGVRAVLAMRLREEVLASIDDALADLALLTPPDHQHQGVHDSFVAHLEALRAIWEALADSPQSLARAVLVEVDGTTTELLADDESWTVVRDGGTAPDVQVVVRYTFEDGGGVVAGGSAGEVQGPPDEIWLELAEQLTAAVCQGAEVFAAARTPLRVSQPASTIPALGELWFYGEGTGCP